VRCPYISHTTITCRIERTSRVVGKTAQHQHESVQHTSSVNFADDGDTQFLTPKLSACPLPYSTQGTPFGLYTTRRDPGGRMRNHLRSWRSDKRELVPRSVCSTSTQPHAFLHASVVTVHRKQILQRSRFQASSSRKGHENV
jgi:hypothetical protein